MIKLVAKFAFILVGLLIGFTGMNWRQSGRDAAAAERFRQQVQLNDSTVAVLASERVKRGQLQGLVTAAKAENGKLVAGMKLLIALDSMRGHIEATPVVSVDSSLHVWQFHDSSAVRVFNATLTVPLFPKRPDLNWTVVPAPLEPSVGFVKIGDRFVATVTCRAVGDTTATTSACKTVTVESPVFDVKAVRAEPRFTRWAGAQWDVVARTSMLRAGVDLRLFGMYAGVEARQRLQAENPQLLLGVIRRF